MTYIWAHLPVLCVCVRDRPLSCSHLTHVTVFCTVTPDCMVKCYLIQGFQPVYGMGSLALPQAPRFVPCASRELRDLLAQAKNEGSLNGQARWPKKSAVFLLNLLKNAESNAEVSPYGMACIPLRPAS